MGFVRKRSVRKRSLHLKEERQGGSVQVETIWCSMLLLPENSDCKVYQRSAKLLGSQGCKVHAAVLVLCSASACCGLCIASRASHKSS